MHPDDVVRTPPELAGVRLEEMVRGTHGIPEGLGTRGRKMTYDQALAEIVRDVLSDRDDVVERRMFGGLAFVVAGSMAVAASGQGGLMVRVDPDQTEALLERPGVSEVVMRGRPMAGWVRVDRDRLETQEQVADWVERGVERVRHL